MSSDSPAAILFSSDGYELATMGGSIIDDTPSILMAGSDGTNAQVIKTTSDGTVRIDPMGTTVQPISGTITANAGSGIFTVSADSLPLPIGAATESTLSSILADSTFIERINTQGQKIMSASTPVVIASDQSPISVSQSGTWIVQPISGTITANQGGAPWSMSGIGDFTVVQASAENLNATVIGTVTSNIGTTNGLALDATLTGGNVKAQMYDGSDVIGTATHPIKIDPTGTTIQPISGTITANAGSGIFTIDGTVTANAGSGSFTVAQPTASNLNAAVVQSTAAALSGAWPVKITDGTNVLPTGDVISRAIFNKLTDGTNTVAITTSSALKIDGSAVTQPISGTITANQGSTWTIQPGNIANTTPWLITLNQGGNSAVISASGALKIDGSAVTQPISGTVTSNIGTTNGLALNSTLTDGTQTSKITDGTNTATVKGASTAAVATDKAIVVAVSPNNTVAITSSSLPLPTGAATETTLASRLADTTFTGRINTLGQKTMANSTPIVIASDQTVVPVSDNGGSLTIDGAITANIGTTNGLALDSSLSIIDADIKATQPRDITDRAARLLGHVTVDSGAITSNIGTTNGLALDTTLTNGTVKAQIYDGSNVIGTSTHPVKTDPTGTTTQPISGTVTANAGSGTFAISGTVTSNIGTTNGLALDSTIAKLTISQGAALDSNTQLLMGGSVTTSAPTYTTGNINPLSLTTSGALRIDGSGTTQPISGTITANAGSGTFTVSGTVTSNQGGAPWSQNITQFGGTNISTGTGTSGAGIPRVTVSNDSNVLSTQSGTWTVQPGNTANTTPWLATINQGSNSASVKAASTAAVATDPALVIAVSPNNTVSTTAPAITKGTQGANGWTTQDLKDAGRVVKIFQASAVAGVTSEAMVTLTPLTDFVAGTGTTSFTVTAGKRLRLQALVASVRATAATAVGATIRLRISANGAVTISTPVSSTVGVYESAAIIGHSFSNWVPLPDGLELSGTMQLGVSQIASATSSSLDIEVIGYEY